MLRTKIIFLLIAILNIRCSTDTHIDLIKENPKDGKIYRYDASLGGYYIENPEPYDEWYRKNGWKSQEYYNNFIYIKNYYYDYFSHKISIYNFGIFSSKELEINLDQYCPSIANRYITLEKPGFEEFIGYFIFRLYNRTNYIIRCHY